MASFPRIICSWLVAMATLVQGSQGSCNFPSFLSSSGRSWKGMISNENRKYELFVRFEHSTVVLTSLKDQIQHSWRCLNFSRDGLFLVEETASNIYDALLSSFERKFCVEFILLSQGVMQIREFPQESKGCYQNLSSPINPWLFISEIQLVRQPCNSFKGGFHFRIFRQKERSRTCLNEEARIESQCLAEEGIVFDFRHQTCIPNGLRMNKMQKTVCVGNWQYSSYNFILLKLESQPTLVILRTPYLPENSFTAHIYKDLLIDDTEHAIDSNFRLDVIRNTASPATSLCTDELNSCSSSTGSCSNDAMKCLRTCKLCNASNPNICDFNRNLFGGWIDGPASVNRASGVFISINASHLTVQSANLGENYRCLRWQSSSEKQRNRHFEDTFIVSEHHDGCRNRYVCLRVFRKSSSILLVKFSRSFLNSVDFDCNEVLHESHFRMFFSQDERVPSQCNLPDDLINFLILYPNATKCQTDFQSNSKQDFLLVVHHCNDNEHNFRLSFTCYDSSPVLPSGNLFIITKELSGFIYCWLFPRGLSRSTDAFYLVDSRNCEPASKGHNFQFEAIFCRLHSRECPENSKGSTTFESRLLNDNRFDFPHEQTRNRHGFITKRTVFLSSRSFSSTKNSLTFIFVYFYFSIQHFEFRC